MHEHPASGMRHRKILKPYREQFLVNIVRANPEIRYSIQLRQHHVFLLTALRDSRRYLLQRYKQLHYCSICAVWIPVGDIDLLREIWSDNRSIADYGRGRPRVRRVYREGQTSDLTITVYQGEGLKSHSIFIQQQAILKIRATKNFKVHKF
ncbi:hypothetical protein B0H13DRAFT_1864093 [Mycena leptocephala]|nr:hypothetical protein B0H13DRAFT_1864093 [Mycena leptocephala]